MGKKLCAYILLWLLFINLFSFIDVKAVELSNNIELGKTISGSLREGQTSDEYKFSITEEGVVLLTLNIPVYANIEVKDSNNNSVYKEEVYPEFISGKYQDITKTIGWDKTLQPGEYTFTINNDKYTKDVNYSFELIYEQKYNENEMNNTSDTACNVEWDKEIRGIADEDFFKFKINKISSIEFNIEHDLSDGSGFYEIIDSNGKTVYSVNINKEIKEEKFKCIFEEGDYFLRIVYRPWNNQKSNNYKFNIKYVGLNDTTLINSELSAKEIRNGDNISGELYNNDLIDYYKISLPQDGTLKLEFESNIQTLVCIIKKGGEFEVGSGYQIPYIRSISIDLSKNEYYFYIKSDYTGQYNIKVQFIPANNNEIEPNNTKYEAKQIVINDYLRGFLSKEDTNDMYKLIVTEKCKVRIEYIVNDKLAVNLNLKSESGGDIIKLNLNNSFNYDIYLYPGKYYLNVASAGDYYTKGTGVYELGLTYLERTPVIEYNNKAINIGEIFNPLENIKAIDYKGNDITSNITVKENTVDTTKEGTYKVVYEVRDIENNYASKEIEVIVKSNEAPKLSGFDDRDIFVGDYFSLMDGVQALDKEDGDLTSKVVTIGNFNINKSGLYNIRYEVTDSDGNLTFKDRVINVKERPVIINKLPILSAEDVTIKIGDTFNPLKYATAIDFEDGNITSRIQVIENDVNIAKVGKYTVKYSVCDNYGAVVTKAIEVTIRSDEKPILVVNNINIKCGEELNLLDNVLALDNEDGDITNLIKVFGKVDTSKIGEYSIIYSIKDSDNNLVTSQTKVTVEYAVEDLNEDSTIDIVDLTKVAIFYNTKAENQTLEKIDINKDGFIDLYDLVKISKKI